LVAAAMAVAGTLLGAGIAAAQTVPLQIPFLEEWAASPHARATEEPFTHWNDDGLVPVPCARCHSTAGFRDQIGADGTPPGLDGPHLPSPGIQCVACHNAAARAMTAVTFPSGAEVTGLGPEARCMTCHQGRESTVSVNKALQGKPDDAVDGKLHFINIHYRAAGATRYGTQVKGGYEYAGKTYAGYFQHNSKANSCQDCHGLHTVRVMPEVCAGCHKKTKIAARSDLAAIRHKAPDYDGDGDVKEGVAAEIAGLQQALLAAIAAYGREQAKAPIVYDGHAYPYFFNDRGNDGKAGPGEAIYPNRYQSWTPRLLRAAYNYQFALKDPGAYTHNPAYVAQLLQDSLADLGSKVTVDMKGMVRP
jgi:hypothetical protein